jgi:hypothetical protein
VALFLLKQQPHRQLQQNLQRLLRQRKHPLLKAPLLPKALPALQLPIKPQHLKMNLLLLLRH